MRVTTRVTHTPGPWERSTRARWVVLGGQRSKAVCVMRNQNDNDPDEQEADANARLIAAAPDLLRSLRTIALWLAHGHHTDEAISDMEKLARDEVARAEGREP